jgi:Domain of unknown function (DUF1841)
MHPSSPAEVRQFWLDAFAKLTQNRTANSPHEQLAMDILAQHREFHERLKTGSDPLNRSYSAGEINPYLHLSMHLAVQEQISSDQPAGLRRLFTELQAATGSAMQAQHHVMQSLEKTMALAQQTQTAPDALAYLVDVSRTLSELT